MTKYVVGVMGPGDCGEREQQLAFEIGKSIAELGYVLLTGGRSRGVMDAASKGAKTAGGLTVGVLATSDLSEISEAVDIPIITGLGSARDNINALSSSVIIAIGMGPGTAAEVALALKANKPVILLAASEEASKFFGTLRPALVHTAETVAAALTLVKSIAAAQQG